MKAVVNKALDLEGIDSPVRKSSAYLCIFIHPIGKGASNLGFCLEETNLDGVNGEKFMSMNQESSGCEA